MSKYALVSINSYRKMGDYAEWSDGMLCTFLHGGEFESTQQEAEDLLMSMRSIGRVTVELTGDDSVVPEYGCKLAPFNSPVEAVIESALGREPDPANPSIYVTTPTAAQFRAGDTFVIGQLSLAEVTDGALQEIKHVTLKHAGIPEELHAIDMIKQ